MIAANLLCPESFPANIIGFPTEAGRFVRDLCSLPPVNGGRSKEAVEEPVKAPKRRSPETPVDAPLLAELFAMKRDEKPPENFMSDFMAEFARRNYTSDKS